MFADSLLETSWAQRIRRSWTTLTSFGLQAVVIVCLLLLPLWKSVGLPSARTVSTPVSLGRPDPGPARPLGHVRSSGVQIIPYAGRIMAPTQVPTTIAKGDDSTSGPIGSIGDPIGDPGLVIGSGSGFPLPFGGTRPVLPIQPRSLPPTFRTSSMLQGNLIRRVEPAYPSLARSARIEGSVVLTATISKAGTIENLHAVSGPPLLVPAALDAVSQWRYRPYILNSEPVEVETQITVNFRLSGG
jgi:periplasmic protein TonB